MHCFWFLFSLNRFPFCYFTERINAILLKGKNMCNPKDVIGLSAVWLALWECYPFFTTIILKTEIKPVLFRRSKSQSSWNIFRHCKCYPKFCTNKIEHEISMKNVGFFFVDYFIIYLWKIEFVLGFYHLFSKHQSTITYHFTLVGFFLLNRKQ